MKNIIALCDYKGRFGSKHFDKPYRSGMDKSLLKEIFNKSGYKIDFIPFTDIDCTDSGLSNKFVLYTSIEDTGYRYKSFIEDVVYGLELAGASVIPSFKHLRANNNKVFMEILRKQLLVDDKLDSIVFGSLEELKSQIGKIVFPCVLKESEGASGTGVYLTNNAEQLMSLVKGKSRSRNYKAEIRDHLRSIKHSNYTKDSKYRAKFIIQEYVPGLVNDWKVYVMGNRLYVFKRPILKARGIKASGGGYENYFYGKKSQAPEGLFDYAYNIFQKLNVPHISLDIGYDNSNFYLFEFQSLYFGTAGIVYSEEYYNKEGGTWKPVTEKLTVEEVYANSIITYIERGGAP